MFSNHLDQPYEGRPRSEEALLLDELRHRVGNEIQASVAAMNLIRSAGRRVPTSLLDRALERMHGFGQVNHVLATRHCGQIDVAGPLRTMCWGLLAGRTGLERTAVTLDLPLTVIDGDVAHRVLLIASELVFNAVRHALAGRRGTLTVSICREDDHTVLVVADDGPGVAGRPTTRGSGLGTSIVAELVRAGRGAIDCSTGPGGTTVRVRLPLAAYDDAF